MLFEKFKAEPDRITTSDLGDAAEAGDAFAKAEIENVARTFGLALVNVLSLTNVERIAIGGGVAKLGEVLLNPIRETVNAHAFVSSQGHYQIRAAELGDEIVLVGAVLRAAEAFA